MHSYCADVLPLDDPVSHSYSMKAGCDTGDYHYDHSNALDIDFDFHHGYCCGNVNYTCDSHKVSMTLVENGQYHCFCVNDYASEHLQD